MQLNILTSVKHPETSLPNSCVFKEQNQLYPATWAPILVINGVKKPLQMAENKWVNRVISSLFSWSYGPLLATGRGSPCGSQEVQVRPNFAPTDRGFIGNLGNP